MKLALLSDIHGNLFALKACMQNLEKIGIDGIVWCGDYITDVPLSHDTLKYIREINKKYQNWIIKGNREDYIIDYHKKTNKNWTMHGNTSSLLLTYQALTNDDLDFISNLPDELYIEIPNAPKIFLSHKKKNDISVDYAIFGHIHVQQIFKSNNTIFFSPGSVGLSNSGNIGAEYMIIELIDNKWIPKKYRQPYDISKPVECIKNSKLNDVTIKWGNAIIKTLETGVDYTEKFVSTARNIAIEQGYSSQLEEIPDNIWDIARSKIGLNALDEIPKNSLEITIKVNESFANVEKKLMEYGFIREWRSQIDDIYYIMDENKPCLRARKQINFTTGKTDYYCSLKNIFNINDNTNNNIKSRVKIDNFESFNGILKTFGIKEVLKTTRKENLYCKQNAIIELQDVKNVGVLIEYSNSTYNELEKNEQITRLTNDLKKLNFDVTSYNNFNKYEILLKK